jgi:hypothetical protein
MNLSAGSIEQLEASFNLSVPEPNRRDRAKIMPVEVSTSYYHEDDAIMRLECDKHSFSLGEGTAARTHRHLFLQILPVPTEGSVENCE